MTLAKPILACLGIAIAGVALLMGWRNDADVFARPARTVFERLRDTQRVVEGSGLGSLTIRSAGTERGIVRLSVMRAGDPRVVICRVTVSAVSAQTSRAELDCAQPGAGDQPLRRLGSDAVAIVVREHVAAAIEDRPYDLDRVADRMIAFAVMRGPAIAATLPPPGR